VRRPPSRRLRRFVGTRSLATIALTAAAVALAGVAGWTILQYASTGDDGPTAGEIPAELPTGFPIPPGAEIGASSVEGLTVTLELTLPGTLGEAVSAHTLGLVSGGYVVDASTADGEGWLIRFSRGDTRGEIALDAGEAGVASVITVRDP
jgi:hypothetical protein